MRFKIRNTGHFLLNGGATEKYATIKKLVGHDLVLTSGVRAPDGVRISK